MRCVCTNRSEYHAIYYPFELYETETRNCDQHHYYTITLCKLSLQIYTYKRVAQKMLSIPSYRIMWYFTFNPQYTHICRCSHLSFQSQALNQCACVDRTVPCSALQSDVCCSRDCRLECVNRDPAIIVMYHHHNVMSVYYIAKLHFNQPAQWSWCHSSE